MQIVFLIAMYFQSKKKDKIHFNNNSSPTYIKYNFFFNQQNCYRASQHSSCHCKASQLSVNFSLACPLIEARDYKVFSSHTEQLTPYSMQPENYKDLGEGLNIMEFLRTHQTHLHLVKNTGFYGPVVRI